jgi:hypothetical protein
MSWRQLEALRDRVRMKDELPVTAIAFFFDDARVEVGNKFSFMGMYGSDVVLTEPGVPFDRLAVFSAHAVAARLGSGRLQVSD